jgi:hypothetical protein
MSAISYVTEHQESSCLRRPMGQGAGYPYPAWAVPCTGPRECGSNGPGCPGTRPVQRTPAARLLPRPHKGTQIFQPEDLARGGPARGPLALLGRRGARAPGRGCSFSPKGGCSGKGRRGPPIPPFRPEPPARPAPRPACGGERLVTGLGSPWARRAHTGPARERPRRHITGRRRSSPRISRRRSAWGWSV